MLPFFRSWCNNNHTLINIRRTSRLRRQSTNQPRSQGREEREEESGEEGFGHIAEKKICLIERRFAAALLPRLFGHTITEGANPHFTFD